MYELILRKNMLFFFLPSTAEKMAEMDKDCQETSRQKRQPMTPSVAFMFVYRHSSQERENSQTRQGPFFLSLIGKDDMNKDESCHLAFISFGTTFSKSRKRRKQNSFKRTEIDKA